MILEHFFHILYSIDQNMVNSGHGNLFMSMFMSHFLSNAESYMSLMNSRSE